MEIVKKLDFSLLLAKYYLYINKLAPKYLAVDKFLWMNLKLESAGGMISKHSFLQLVRKNSTLPESESVN